jgi:formate--tetrahydrofolate ligase
LAALIDNHLHWNKEPILDVNRIGWRRVVDMNDRALRNITVGLGARGDGIPRSDGFDITVASEIMAIFCLSTDLKDLTRRLGQIVVGYTRANKPVTATDLCAEGALSALLRDALAPNMVQTLENNPAIIHGGPFANIAHGCSSVISTKTSLKLADYVVTEGGFGADLGAEKFFNIKCRKSGLRPDCVVVIATVRALKFHGGADEKTLQQEPSVEAVKSGIHSNLKRHLENIQKFGVPAVVAVNKFPTDTPEELATVLSECEALGFTAVLADHHNDGGAGAADLAQTVADTIDEKKSDFKFLYPDDMPLTEKVRTIAREIYGASDIAIDSAAATKFKKITNDGYGDFPVCMAKTQYSFSADPTVRGAPTGHVLPIKDVRLSAGAEFVVVLTGAIMQMPGLPKLPASEKVGVGEDGEIYGLF